MGNSQLSGPFRSRKGSLAVVVMSGIEADVLHADDFLSSCSVTVYQMVTSSAGR